MYTTRLVSFKDILKICSANLGSNYRVRNRRGIGSADL